jgi:fatty acid-binding protein DegV
MQATSVLDESYDGLDIATSAAVEYVRRFQSSPAVTTGETAVNTTATAPRARATPPMAARTLIMVDTACELPQAWLEYHHVGVMPRVISTKFGDLVETRDREDALRFIRQLSVGENTTAQSHPLSPVKMRDHAQKYMSVATDSVLQLSSAATRGKFYVNALSATQSLVLIHNKVRRTVGNKTPLTAWVIDSLNALSGVGVQLAHAVMLRDNGAPASDIAVTMNAFRQNVHTLIAADDLSFIERTARNIEKVNVSSIKIKLANLLNFKPVVHLGAQSVNTVYRARGHTAAMEYAIAAAETELKRGLATPFICISYAGNLNDVESLASYKTLRGLCSRNQVSLSLSLMSMTGALQVGPRALCVSFASQYYRG